MSLNEQFNQTIDIAHSPENTTTFSEKKGFRVFREIVSGMVGFIASIPVCFVILMAFFFLGHWFAPFLLDVTSIIATVIMGICVASFVAAGVYWTSKNVRSPKNKWLSFIGAYIGMSCGLLLGFSSAYLEDYYYHYHDFFENLRSMALVLSPVLALVGAIMSFETMQANSLKKANIQSPKSNSRS